jgi:DNA-binding response OmpR family regulator
MSTVAWISRDALLSRIVSLALAEHSVEWLRPDEHLHDAVARLRPGLILLDTNQDNISVITSDKLREQSYASVLALAFPDRNGRQWSSQVAAVLEKPIRPGDLEAAADTLLRAPIPEIG